MQIIYHGWRIVGDISIADDDGNLIVIGTTPEGQPAKNLRIAVDLKKAGPEAALEAMAEVNKICGERFKGAQEERAKQAAADSSLPSDWQKGIHQMATNMGIVRRDDEPAESR